ncbi:MAG TPA: 50S ribosomal protein L11 methyltransferase [Ignavibacteriaceae bacterium]|nr:50S ribosomal protein L11 methyltransferase [Ignavibacteriaceae bacterium]
MIKHFKKFIITAEPFNPELISGLLWTLEIEGIKEEPDRIEAFINIKSKITKENIKSLLHQLVTEKLITSFIIEEELIENKNWNAEWEKSVNIIEVSDKIIIKPSFKKYIPKKDQIVIEINPKMSFGTGEHQTTKLILEALEKHLKSGMKILDVGTGTGILAIASIKLGAASAAAIDNDEWSYLNAKENCLLNNAGSKIDIMLAEIIEVKEKDYDLIAANIQRNTLIEIAEELRCRLRANGILILSGLLKEDEPEIFTKYFNLGFKLLEVIRMDEWTAIVLNYIPELHD